MDGLKDGGISPNVTRGCKAETTDETSTHITENITVKLRGKTEREAEIADV